MRTMMALRAHTRGGPEQLVYESAPIPTAGPGEALVAVRAAGITFAELTWDLSWTTRDGVYRTPVIPSHEVCGTVAALGPAATGVVVGEDVYGLIDFDRDGAAAQYVTVPAEALAAKPATVSYAEAATLPLAALAAWQALVDHAKVQSGERVLVVGAAGGVGVYAVQIAAALGAHVVAADVGVHAGLVRDLGAAEFVDTDTTLFPDRLSTMDVVLDGVGGEALPYGYSVARPGGRLVSLGAPPDESAARAAGVRAMYFIVTPDRAELTGLARWVDDGTLRPVVGATFPLSEGGAAYESGHGRHNPGKTVLLV
jgi:NADPH:quinone reductase-like Zn-dependent oxidoreductase